MIKKSDIKIVGIVCSPRFGSNTQILMEIALASSAEHGAKVEMITIADKKLAPCDRCNG